MIAFKCLTAILAFAASTIAQGQFGQPENSATVLQALQAVHNATVKSGRAAAAYMGSSPALKQRLTNTNIVLRSDWYDVEYVAQSSVGFYTNEGAQAIIDYINSQVYPSTRDADEIYVKKRNVFVASGFINFINPGLLRLRTAVDAASAAVQAKTPACKLAAMTQAFTLVAVDYATTQEIQQFGPQ